MIKMEFKFEHHYLPIIFVLSMLPMFGSYISNWVSVFENNLPSRSVEDRSFPLTSSRPLTKFQKLATRTSIGENDGLPDLDHVVKELILKIARGI